jgi:hypothetical protein
MRRAQVEGAFSEAAISKAHSFWLDVLVRLPGEKRLRMTDLGWHGQHRKATLFGYGTPFCFCSRGFPRLFLFGINTGQYFSPPDRSQAEAGWDDIS